MKKILFKTSFYIIFTDVILFLTMITRGQPSNEMLLSFAFTFVALHAVTLLKLFNQMHDTFPDQYDQ